MIDPNELANGDVEGCALAFDEITEGDDVARGEEEEMKANVLVILGQLDPTETVDGRARWTAAQSKIILKASDFLGEAQ